VVGRVVAPLVRRLWPADLQGLENLPDHGRYLVVANHSGLGSAELLSLLVQWTDRFGDTRPLAGMAHRAGFEVPPLRQLLQGYGAVEATRAGAAWARAHETPLLVFPGGDAEAMRPAWRAGDVDFFGRCGWIRLAREHGLDLVPLCISNSHHTIPTLPVPGRLVAQALGLGLLGAPRAPLPIHAALLGMLAGRALHRRAVPWPLALAGALATFHMTTMIPVVPAQIGFDFLPTIRRDELDAPDHVVYERVVGALQSALDRRRS